MADLKSCEGKITTLECMECGFREVFTEQQFKTVDGYRCFFCDGMVTPEITRPGEKLKNRRMDNPKNRRRFAELTVDIDVTDALKGLKAVQREARKAATALREVEEFRMKIKE